MSRGEKLLESMRANPRDWRIEDVRTLCRAFELDFDKPSGGSHYGVRNPETTQKVTIPFAKPIKPVYIKQLVRLVEAAKAAGKEG
jgi:hypothetical protein